MSDFICRPGDPGYVVPGSKEYREHLGCSEIADIMGYGYNSPLDLWKKKTHKAPDTAHKRIFDRGHDMEPIMARMIREKGRVLLAEQVQYRDPDRPWLIYHADGMFPKWSPLEDDDEPRKGAGIWEAKAPGGNMAYEMSRKGMTPNYVCQGQGGMHVASAALGQPILWGTYGYLDYDEYDVVAFDVGASPKFQAKILDAVDEFWGCVQTDTPPKGLEEIARVEPPVIKGELEVVEDEQLTEWALALTEVREQLAPLKDQEKSLVTALKKRLDPYALAEIPGIMKFSYKAGAEKVEYDGPGLVAYCQHVVDKINGMLASQHWLDKYGPEINAVPFNPSHFITRKPGTRRFVPTAIKE